MKEIEPFLGICLQCENTQVLDLWKKKKARLESIVSIVDEEKLSTIEFICFVSEELYP